MKTIYVLLVLITITLLSSCTTSPVEELIETELESVITTEQQIIEVTNLTDTAWGSGSALEEQTFSIEEMLIYAIQDEYTAKSEYIMIMEKFDITKPFSNIYESEGTHISLLIPLFEVYEISVPEDTSTDHLFEVDTLKESFEIGVIAEINNIAMYNLFLTQDLPDDIEAVFIRLRDASENHLSAFEKNLAKYL